MVRTLCRADEKSNAPHVRARARMLSQEKRRPFFSKLLSASVLGKKEKGFLRITSRVYTKHARSRAHTLTHNLDFSIVELKEDGKTGFCLSTFLFLGCLLFQ